MKKSFLNLTTMLLLGMPLVFVACDDDTQEEKEFDRAANIDYNQENREQWANYMSVVSNLLKTDATTLYHDWATSFNGGVGYGTLFKKHDNEDYGSAINCIETILDGCADIASEVGSAKIGDPYNLYVSGRKSIKPRGIIAAWLVADIPFVRTVATFPPGFGCQGLGNIRTVISTNILFLAHNVLLKLFPLLIGGQMPSCGTNLLGFRPCV